MDDEAPQTANYIGQPYGQTLIHDRLADRPSQQPGGPEYLTRQERDEHAASLSEAIIERAKIGQSPRYEMWQLEYYKNMYLSDCSGNEFIQQWDDVWLNLTVVSPEHKIGPDMEAHQGQADYWGRRFQHLLCESQFRGGNPAWVSREEPSKMAGQWLRPIRNLPTAHWNRHWIFKFGKLEHIRQARDEEAIRFAPAHWYDDPSLNDAQRDSEGNASWRIPGSSLPLGAFRLESGEPLELATGNVTIAQAATYPFYIWCASGRYRPQIANAFLAEAVLVIRDRKRFERDLSAAIRRAGIGDMMAADVWYFDPFQKMTKDIPIQYLKNHRFMYQKELRYSVLETRRPKEDMNAFFIHVPGMKKYTHWEVLRNE